MSGEDPKIHVLLGGKKHSPADDLLKRAHAEWDDHVKLLAFEAKRKKSVYDSYIDAGFTPDQALQLVK